MDRLAFRYLDVRSFYGYAHPGLALRKAEPGLNVVFGPNGQGKTTLARALQGVLWPETVRPFRPSLEAAFETGAASWHVAFDAGEARYQRDGADADRLALPDALHRACFHLPLTDLLLDDDTAFADAIARDAAGGVDLRAVREALGFRPAGPQRTLAETTRASEAAARVRELTREREALRADEARLEELHRRIEDATAQAERAHFYALLEERAARAAEAERAFRAIQAFPEALARVTADTAAQHHALAEACARTAAEAEAARAAAQAALAAAAAHAWAGVQAPDLLLRETRARARGAAERDRVEARRRHAGAAERERRARGALGDTPGPADAVSHEALAALGTAARHVARLAARRDELAERQRAVRARLTALKPHPRETLMQGIVYLRRWLAYTAHDARQAPALPVGALAGAAVLLAALAVAAGVFWHPAALLLLAGAGALAVVAALARRGAPAAADPAEAARQGFGLLRLELEPLAEWTPPAVEQLLDTLERRLLTQEERLLWQDRADELERERLAADDHVRAALAEGRRAAGALGLDLPESPEAAVLLAHQIAAWQQAAHELAEAEGARADAERAADEALGAFNALLGGLPAEPVQDHAAAEATLAAVGRALAARDRLAEAARAAQTRAEEAEAASARARAARAEAARHLGLDAPDDEAVAALAAQFEPYRSACAEAERARTLAADADRKARAHACFNEAALALTPGTLAEARAGAQAAADARDGWMEEAARIRERIAQARATSALAEARAEHAAALDALGDAYERHADARVGHVLATFVEEETREQHLPRVFRRAQDLFGTITADRYRLAFRDNAFRAADVATGRSYALAELSCGTRLQLLLAVRLAFAEQQELGLRLPLVLDETLATSDDARAAAVAAAVFALCREGRQVFYFTAQREEVDKWQRLAQATPDVPCAFHTLPANGVLALADLAATPDPAALLVPAPDGHAPDAYADVLCVPPWNGHEDLGALHLWYLLEDSDDLHACLMQGYARWGQIETALRRKAPLPLSEEALARVRLRARTLGAWQDAWRVGRGRPVSRATLEDSGAVSAAFIDALSDFCAAHGGCARALMQHLRSGGARGFWSSKADELEDYLLRHGYLSEDDPLSNDEVRHRLLAAVPEARAPEAWFALERVWRRSERLGAEERPAPGPLVTATASPSGATAEP
ncbi:MAG: hypothetical protein ACK41D_07690 [Rubricoccaceae bacterium]